MSESDSVCVPLSLASFIALVWPYSESVSSLIGGGSGGEKGLRLQVTSFGSMDTESADVELGIFRI